MNLLRLNAIIRKEFLHILRDPKTLALIFLIPIIQMVLLGYAATTDIDDVPLAVMDNDHSAASRDLIRGFGASGYFEVTNYPDSQEEVEWLMDHGDVRGVLLIPAGYGAALMSGQGVDVGLLVDGSDPSVANGVLLSGLQTGQAQARAMMAQLPGLRGGLDVRPTVWYNPGMESANFMIPALMGMILQFLATLVTSMAIVKEREYGTMEQLIVTPISASELVIGKTVPYILLSFVDFGEVLLVGVFWFGVPIRGSLLLLLALALLFLIGSLAIGILISTAASTQQEAMLMSFLILMPSIFLSGFFFPLEAMPVVLQVASYLVPLRYMLIIVRGIVLKGIGLPIIQGEVLILGIFSAIMLLIAGARFRKHLD